MDRRDAFANHAVIAHINMEGSTQSFVIVKETTQVIYGLYIQCPIAMQS